MIGEREQQTTNRTEYSERRTPERQRPREEPSKLRRATTPGAMTNHQSPITNHLPRLLVWVAIGFFVLNVLALIAVVVVNSFATTWLGTWLPSGFTLRWYSTAWSEFQLDSVLTVTVEVVFAVVAISLLLGVPAAYALARRNFRFKRVTLLIFVLPLLVPPMTYGIQLATLLYSLHLGGTITGVILGNLVPAVPFVILVMTPFIEQIDPKLEAAARVFGAGALTPFPARSCAATCTRYPCCRSSRYHAHDRYVRTNLFDRRSG